MLVSLPSSLSLPTPSSCPQASPDFSLSRGELCGSRAVGRPPIPRLRRASGGIDDAANGCVGVAFCGVRASFLLGGVCEYDEEPDRISMRFLVLFVALVLFSAPFICPGCSPWRPPAACSFSHRICPSRTSGRRGARYCGTFSRRRL